MLYQALALNTNRIQQEAHVSEFRACVKPMWSRGSFSVAKRMPCAFSRSITSGFVTGTQ